MKIRSYDELELFINTDLNWRRQELTTHLFLLKKAREHEKKYLTRAGVAILYAHWEGFIKNALQAYFHYMEKYGVCINNASAGIRSYLLLRHTSSDFDANNRFKIVNDICRILTEEQSPQIKNIHEGVSTKSNLNSEVLDYLMLISDMDNSFYESKKN